MNEPLDEKLRSLPREVTPSRDLWSGIAAELEVDTPRLQRMRVRAPSARSWQRTLLYALAAASAVGCVAGALTWAIVHSRLDETVTARVTAQNAQFEDLKNPKYIAAHDALQRTFHERLTRLDPQTRQKIETSLTVIQKAHAEIGAALNADPMSPILEQLWQSTWHQELDLYDSVVQGTEPTFARI